MGWLKIFVVTLEFSVRPYAGPDSVDVIPESLLQGVLEAEREQQTRTGGHNLKLPVMYQSDDKRKESESATTPPATCVEAGQSAKLADGGAHDSKEVERAPI